MLKHNVPKQSVALRSALDIFRENGTSISQVYNKGLIRKNWTMNYCLLEGGQI
jgi:hypothetical protein